jgi:hypothetical protein
MASNKKQSVMGMMPGMDFVQNLWKAAPSIAQTLPPSLTQWIAPTTNVEEIDKKITDLKAVQAWLETNANMVKATVQALEVQRMTLSTLKSMKVNVGDVTDVLTGKKKPGEEATLDPAQWWGALSKQITQPFAQMAGQAMKESAKSGAKSAAKNTAGAVASTAAGLAMDAAFTAAEKSFAAAQQGVSTAKRAAGAAQKMATSLSTTGTSGAASKTPQRAARKKPGTAAAKRRSAKGG